jgi:hypothetical protein
VKIRVDKEHSGLPNHCLTNVMAAVAKNGGSAVFGWVREGFGVIIALYGHVCWQKPDGEVVCITPSRSGGQRGEIEFFANDTVREEWQRTGFQPVKIRTPDPTLTAYIRRSEQAYIHGRFAMGGYWTDKANALAHRYGVEVKKRHRTDGDLTRWSPAFTLFPVPQST